MVAANMTMHKCLRVGSCCAPHCNCPDDELAEARQLAARYRAALHHIVAVEHPWCDGYAECDHVGCEASHRHVELATAALCLDDG
jgi:hypothetical protein